MKKSTFLLSVCLMFIFTVSVYGTTYTSTASGNWSTQVWTPAGTPGVSDDVVIADGHTVIIDQNVAIANLTVGGGTSGKLTFDGTSGRVITVSGNITVSAGGSFIVFQALTPTGDVTLGYNEITNVSSTAGIAAFWNISGTGIAAGTTVSSFTANTIVMSLAATATGTAVPLSITPALADSMVIGGNLINNGIFDMSLGTSTTVCNVKFNSAGDQTITGTGATTRFRIIYLDKVAVANKVICNTNVSTSNLNVVFLAGTWEQTAGRLSATSGSINIGSLTATNCALNIVGSGSAQIASSINVYGKLLVNTSDSLIVGVGASKIDQTYIAGSSATYTSGTVVIYGKFASSALCATIVNGANIIIDPKGFTATDYAFRTTTGGGTNPFTFTSGTITILNPNSFAAANPELAMSSSIAPNISGTAKFVLGQGASTVGTAQGFRINLNSVSLLNNLKFNTGTIGVTLQTNVTVKGTLELTSSGTMTPGAFALKYGSGGTLEYNGSALQTTSSFEFPPSDSTYKPTNVTVNNPGGVALHAARTIPGTLALTSGKLALGSNNLTLGPAATISGASASNFIIADGAGELRKQIADTASLPLNIVFPVGDNTGTAEYAPVKLTFTSGTFTSASAAVRLSNVKHPSNPSLLDYLNRYWTVTQSGITNFSCDASFTYADADIAGTETKIYCGKYNNPGWTLYSQANATTNTLFAFEVSSLSDFTGGEQGSIPVELSSFEAKASSNAVVLNWITATETNNTGYEIERSFDNQPFVKIGFVKGAGTSTISKAYTYSDNKLVSGQYSYRLKQIDFDGKFTYSNVVLVTVTTPDKFEIAQNYPNPFNPSTRIDYQIPFDAKVSIELYDIAGEKVATLLSDVLAAGYYTTDVNAVGLDLVSGVYFYRFTATGSDNKTFTQVKKMMLNK